MLILLQIAVIILVTRIVGHFLMKIGQPLVIGEIIGGIILGPSVLGKLAPAVEISLFPQSSLGNLQILGQLGLTLFMFVVGAEIDLTMFRKQTFAVIVISQSSIIAPFLVGLAGGSLLYGLLAPRGISFLSWELFIGIAVSITAFPVLVRILQERGMSRSRVGVLAITCAAADDVISWCLLAVVVAIVKAQSAWSSVYTIVLGSGFVLTMLVVVRPLLKKWLSVSRDKGVSEKNKLVILLLLLLFSASSAELIGIHSLFGAFLAGIIVPADQNLKESLVNRIEYISVILCCHYFLHFQVCGHRSGW
jgi:Kef-type K+ transport system membrane component KefB